MAQALRNLGHTVHMEDLRRMRKRRGLEDVTRHAMRTVRRQRPDFVLIYARAIPPETIQALAIDVPSAAFNPDYNVPLVEEVVKSGALVDHYFVTNPDQLEEYRAAGVKNPHFLMQACCNTEHHPVRVRRKQKWGSQVAFIGRPSSQRRIDLLKRVGEKFDLKIWGPNWSKVGMQSEKEHVSTRDYRKICSASTVMLGHNFPQGVRLCFSNRNWITLGCAGLLLTPSVPGLETILENGRDLVTYSSTEECLVQIENLTAKPTLAGSIRESGFRRAHSENTYEIRMAELLRTMGLA